MKYKFILIVFLLWGTTQAAIKEAKPVTPKASKEAAALLQFFYDISGKYTLTGQHNYPNTHSRNSEFYARYVGKTPTIYSSDMGFAEDGDTDSYLARPDIVQEAIKQHKAGALVTLCWHAVPPTADEPVTFQPRPGVNNDGNLASVQGQLTDQQFKDVLTPGTELYKHWCKQVDAIAVFLKQLDEAHVPVLWRPYHEMNGGWFWWGGRTGEYSTKALYIQMYNRLVKHHKIKNLIWVWSVDRPNKPEMKFTNYYPGDEYVDILALDVYGSDFNQAYYDSLNALSHGKPMVLGEVGNPPELEILAAQPRWSYWVIWAGMVRNTFRKKHQELVSDPRMLVMEKQSYWDLSAPYHQACGLTGLAEEWIVPAVFKAADFSGNWEFNEEQSVLGRFGAGMAPYKIDVTQDDDEIKSVRTMIVEYGDDRVSDETIKLDGSEFQSNTSFRNSVRTSTAHWSAMGDTLTINSTMSFGGGDQARTINSTEVWTLDSNGRVLSITQSSESPWGKQETTLIYDRTCGPVD